MYEYVCGCVSVWVCTTSQLYFLSPSAPHPLVTHLPSEHRFVDITKASLAQHVGRTDNEKMLLADSVKIHTIYCGYTSAFFRYLNLLQFQSSLGTEPCQSGNWTCCSGNWTMPVWELNHASLGTGLAGLG